MKGVVIAIVVLAGVAVAQPQQAQRKTAPDKFARAAGESFVAAAKADQEGDLPGALGLYQKAFAISPHPSTAYNIADVQRRLGHLTDAIKSFEMYLAIYPDAADRRAVETLIDKLVHTPGSVFVMSGQPRDPRSIDLSTAYVLIDGKLVSKPGTTLVPAGDAGPVPGIELTVAPGTWTLDAVTPLTYGTSTCRVQPGERSLCTVSAPPRTDGAAVISGDDRFVQVATVRGDRRADSRMQTRFEHAPGRAKLIVRDRSYECPALVIEVPAGGDVAYAFLSTQGRTTVDRCRSFIVTKQKLHFAP